MSLTLRRVALGVYLACVATALLWPGIVLPDAPIERPDLVAHAGMFGLLTLLMVGARVGGSPTLGVRNVAVGGLVSLALASGLEAAQGIPGINRSSGLDDGLANALGVALVSGALGVIGVVDRSKRRDGQG
ncbi:MAG: hypothetical protein AAGH64_08140 [Planctomycetota bacterium]